MSDSDRKLYQLVISRLDGDMLSTASYQDRAFELAEKGIGGFILFGGKKEMTGEVIDKLQSFAAIPLFIASDIERGVGQQIEGASCFPCQMALAAAIGRDGKDNGAILEQAVRAIADEAVDTGINMPLIPVMDVNLNPDNPIICTRAFSDNPEDVSWYGRKYIRILEDAGLLSCAKHFPGHGDTAVDSHISLPVISKSLDDLMEADIFPFRESVNAGVSSIMVGHLSIPEIDILPASLSGKIITGLLRQELGFKGLVMTDALNMHALDEFRDAPARCINAGTDIILHPADADAAVEVLKQGISSGEVDESMIDAAVERILRYKSKIKNIRKPDVDYNGHARLAEEIAGRSVTCVKDAPGLLPIRDIHGLSLVYSGNENEFDMHILKDFVTEKNTIVNISGPDVQNVPAGGTVIIALFTHVAAWKGSSGIRDEDMVRIRKLTGTSGRSVVISFGSPYILRHVPDADVLIAAYDTTPQAQRAVIRCLRGERVFSGRLPVRLGL